MDMYRTASIKKFISLTSFAPVGDSLSLGENWTCLFFSLALMIGINVKPLPICGSRQWSEHSDLPREVSFIGCPGGISTSAVTEWFQLSCELLPRVMVKKRMGPFIWGPMEILILPLRRAPLQKLTTKVWGKQGLYGESREQGRATGPMIWGFRSKGRGPMGHKIPTYILFAIN